MKLLLLVFKNLLRNKLRSALTVLAVIVLVAIFSLIATVLLTMERAMRERARDVPVVLSERYRFPSRFDRRFVEDIVSPGTAVHTQLRYLPGFNREHHTIWHFIGFTTDPERKDKNKQFFVIATYPEKIPAMFDELDQLDPVLLEKMKRPPKSGLDNSGILMGPDRMERLGLRVGDVFKAISISHFEGVTRQPIEMQLEIVGTLPAGSRWVQHTFMDYAYLDRVLKEKKSEMDGKIMLGWLKFDDSDSAGKGSAVIETHISDIKSEIASTAISRFLEPYKNLFNGVKYLLVPAIWLVMTLIVANAISITVRERTTEMAVLKVLGFRPPQILALVLGEAVLLGTLGGLFGAGGTYFLVNHVIGGINFPIGFFPIFFVPAHALWWGPALGALTSVLGGIIPAWSARSVRVSEVFARVA
ncbi:MAG TPA: ABC transporter permease [Gemmataceae bacterium]|nr:ABC transporter permease [Gemmataceae bacterium]